ncbi:alkaline phosphatase family protein [Edaphobacter dinghuensis]|uniref:Alkaline phosphatase family protein n=2 Tax=Edaphobacter dinghuensis TaxID=1560005 RepID=A0A917H1S1_9BACT|nr:alkaline phosphatase family protein [Edaphobacter dinghuensis]
MHAQVRRPVLMISIDALNPHYVLKAGDRAGEIPFLRSLLTNGVYAESVLNVVPTITNPNHVTLITGTWPERHGIFNNMLQDPIANTQGLQMEYGNAIRVRTLWQAAKAAGLTTASVDWPVSLGAYGIDYNIPSITLPQAPEAHYLLEAVSRPDGFLEHVEKEIGTYSPTEDEDNFTTHAAQTIIREQRPYFFTVHLSGLDEAQHRSGPDTPDAYQALARIDGLVHQLVDDERKVYPDADIVIVSDHGFFPVSHVLNLNSEFVRHGLITISQTPSEHIASWKAFTWTGGGSAVILLHDSSDTATRDKVANILADLQKNPANGIARVLSKKEAASFGGTPQAEFLIDCRPGFYIGRGLTTPLITSAKQKGTHGFLPTHPELQSAFFMLGPGVIRGKNLGVVDMRQIAPTVAKELNANLPEAEEPPLSIRN